MKQSRTEINKKEYAGFAALSWLYSIAVAAAVTALVFTVWLRGIKISGEAMAPGFSSGDVVLFDRLAKHVYTPKRGDVYAYERGGAAVGRIVGLPGDRVEMKDGAVYIDGCRLDESRYDAPGDWTMEELTLKQGEFLLLPDRREGAAPSPELMAVDFYQLIGRAAVRVSPITRAAVFVNR